MNTPMTPDQIREKAIADLYTAVVRDNEGWMKPASVFSAISEAYSLGRKEGVEQERKKHLCWCGKDKRHEDTCTHLACGTDHEPNKGCPAGVTESFTS